MAETALPAGFGASRPSETDSLRKTDTIGSFFIVNRAIGARFGAKTCFWVPLGAEFQFCDKIVAGLEIKKPPGQFTHNQKQQFSKNNTVDLFRVLVGTFFSPLASGGSRPRFWLPASIHHFRSENVRNRAQECRKRIHREN